MFAAGEIENTALSLGIDACGVAPAHPLPEDAAYLRDWTAAGYHGSMDYLARNITLREDICRLVPEAQTVVVCLFNYYKTAHQTTDAPRIAQCGLSQTDYHIFVKQKLTELAEALCVNHPQCIFPPVGGTGGGPEGLRVFCDSAPVLERRWAERAGLGWIGKNHLLIHPTLGSFVHIGILALPEACETYATPLSNRCGSCEKCLNACPTGTLHGTHFDARRCVSYLTIERKEPLDEKYKNIVACSLYGCDRCQDVCPYNEHLQETTHTALQANPQLLTLTASDWLNTSRRQKLKLLRRLAKE